MQITFLTYNIRNCRGVGGKVSLGRTAGTIARTGAVVAGLQEVDRYNPRSCFADQARKFGKMLQMQAVFGPNINPLGLIGFGNAVLSVYPISAWYNYQLPREGERRGLLRAEICAGPLGFAFYNTHLGLDENERLRQVDKIISVVGAEKLPLVLVGDFNAPPDAPEMRAIAGALPPNKQLDPLPTFPSVRPEHQIDYIFYSRHWRLVEQRVFDSQASDHLPLAARLQLVPEE